MKQNSTETLTSQYGQKTENKNPKSWRLEAMRKGKEMAKGEC
jgi:hypothetical protein